MLGVQILVCAGVFVTLLILDLFLFSLYIGGIHVRNRVLWKFMAQVLRLQIYGLTFAPKVYVMSRFHSMGFVPRESLIEI
jgi:hypothetical protein